MTQQLYLTKPTLTVFCLLICLFGGYSHAQCKLVSGSTPLYWDANSEPNIDSYKVYRSLTSGSGYSVIGTTAQGPGPVSFTDTTPLSTGYYVVTAVNTSGLESGFSNELCLMLTGGTSNNAPTPMDDSATTSAETAVPIAVLSNDSDPDGDTLTVASVTPPTNGSVLINVDQTVSYTPASNFNGSDSFTYTVIDGQGGSATATVTVTVTAVNNAPTPMDDSATTSEETAVPIAVLSNDSDPDGDTLTVASVTPPTNGSVLINVDQTVSYTPASNFNGSDSFTYTVIDGQGGSATATVTVTVTATLPPGDNNTVLVAHFMNGSNAVLNSRVYLWNPSASAGDVTVRVFTLLLTGGFAQELTATPLNLGTLGAKSARNVKLAEDILTPLGILLPYTDNGGNLTLEFTIGAPNVRGAAQVFSSSMAFGSYPLQEILSTSKGNPTVLVANFMNGNDAEFNSRVYLWNPSANAGNVRVRVFTLPHTGDSLLLGEVDLGILEASSARNVKLAEDILTPLGIPLPYTADGGNLTLEFTIGAPNVQGAAQVFSSSLAFGTYPLQEILSTSKGNPTVLVANFMNGNNAFVNSRVYLWNPSANAGQVTVRVFTLPLTGGLAQELTATPLNLGILGARSARNVKLAEDILAPLGILLPYTDDGGNLTLEFTIGAPNVRGAAQVFSSNLAFGTYLLQEIQSTSSGSPTVLVANFMNGNDAAFNSRVYLWNPSASAGDVTVRVFTLPLTGGFAQELTATPLNLGTLGARSARNVKLAEDILVPLGIPLPYTDDGGNLTLEFTIGAPNVRGAAQVFSSSLAFGTAPLEVIQ